jgi:hypothetical protein
MGLGYSAKCPHCWDTEPCSCGYLQNNPPGQPAAQVSIEENNRLLRQQNELLAKLVEQGKVKP